MHKLAMYKHLVRSSCGVLAVSIALGATVSAHAGQNGPNFGGIFGAILNSALANQKRAEWEHRPLADYNCLAAHNMSADQLAANGIGPNDPRVRSIFAQCAEEAANASRAAATPVVTAPTGPYNPDFVVDGLSVGAAVNPDSPAYKAYKCRPSEQFPGFKWCAIKRSHDRQVRSL